MNQLITTFDEEDFINGYCCFIWKCLSFKILLLCYSC